jgi:hypothetical protein
VFRIKLPAAVGADSVAELGFRIVPNVALEVVPHPGTVTNVLAGRADGEQTTEYPDFADRLLKFRYQPLTLGLRGLAAGDIAENHARSQIAIGIAKDHRRNLDREEAAILAAGAKFAVSLARAGPLLK